MKYLLLPLLRWLTPVVVSIPVAIVWILVFAWTLSPREAGKIAGLIWRNETPEQQLVACVMAFVVYISAAYSYYNLSRLHS